MKTSYNEDYFQDINEQTVDKKGSKYKKFLSYCGTVQAPQQVLDLGCGSGTLCAYIASLYPDARVIGLDAFELPLNAATEKYPELEFKKCNFLTESFPLEADSIDLIVSHEVIEHLMPIDNYIKESFRVLRPGGKIILKTPNGYDAMRLIAPLCGRRWYADEDKTHVAYYNYFSLKKLLSSFGFVEVQTFTGTKPLLAKPRIPAIPILGNGLVAVAKKP